MSKRLKIKLSSFFILMILFSTAFAGVSDFNVDLPWWNGEKIAVNWRTKTTNVDGSHVKFNTATTGRGYVFAKTKVQFSNSGQIAEFSPFVKLSTSTSTNHWLGSYLELNASAGDKAQIILKSDVWNGDQAAGTWDYK